MSISLIIDQFVELIKNSKMNVVSGGYYPSTIRKLRMLICDLKAAIIRTHNLKMLEYLQRIDSIIKENSVNEYTLINELMKIKYMN